MAQAAYDQRRFQESDDVSSDVFEAMRVYLTEDLGIPSERALARARREIERGTAAPLASRLERQGLRLAGSDVLDLGAGLGAMSEELARRAARVTAVEPGASWASITRRRLAAAGASGRCLRAAGEDLPFSDASFDLVVSRQVLEHVRSPDRVLAEVWRVLRPGGHFFLSCENYLAFWEGHYQVPWFPLLPKSVGGVYLAALGRSPAFLREAVTYTTYPSVMRTCRRLGFVSAREQARAVKYRSMGGRGAELRLMLVNFGDRCRRTFKFGMRDLFVKPGGC